MHYQDDLLPVLPLCCVVGENTFLQQAVNPYITNSAANVDMDWNLNFVTWNSAAEASLGLVDSSAPAEKTEQLVCTIVKYAVQYSSEW